MTRPSQIKAAETQRTVLRETLRLAVPMWMVEVDGLPLDMLTGIATASAVTVGTHGDDLQFGGKHTRDAFNALARGLAVAALVAWGGVTYEGLHWCATPGCRDPGDADAHPQPYPDAVKDPPPRRPVDELPDLSAWPAPAA